MRLPLIDRQDHNLTSLIILSFKWAKLNTKHNRRKKIHHLLYSLFLAPASQLVYLYTFQKTGTTLPNFSIKTCKLVIYIRLCGWHFSDTCENHFNWFQCNVLIKLLKLAWFAQGDDAINFAISVWMLFERKFRFNFVFIRRVNNSHWSSVLLHRSLSKPERC